jgi:hypothetical protein
LCLARAGAQAILRRLLAYALIWLRLAVGRVIPRLMEATWLLRDARVRGQFVIKHCNAGNALEHIISTTRPFLMVLPALAAEASIDETLRKGRTRNPDFKGGQTLLCKKSENS